MTNEQKYRNIPDTAAEAEIIHQEMLALLDVALSTLSDRDRFIICSLYGVKTQKLSETELSIQMGLTQGRLAQKKQKILKKLRNYYNNLGYFALYK